LSASNAQCLVQIPQASQPSTKTISNSPSTEPGSTRIFDREGLNACLPEVKNEQASIHRRHPVHLSSAVSIILTVFIFITAWLDEKVFIHHRDTEATEKIFLLFVRR
jgi:hypothetical protein